ncbi:segregation/condensation protein A, partial [Halorubrum sp. SD626R]
MTDDGAADAGASGGVPDLDLTSERDGGRGGDGPAFGGGDDSTPPGDGGAAEADDYEVEPV